MIWWLERFRTADQSDKEWRIYIIDTFLKAAYLYVDGRMLLHLNFAGDNNTVSLQLAEDAVTEGEALCSCKDYSGSPKAHPKG